jgi:CubicO group peptidase (beta-lactamase class C family)
VASSSGARLSTFTALTLWDGAFFGGKMISPSDVEVVTTPPRGITMGLPAGNTQSNIAEGYGFGRVVGHDEGRRIVWHNGGILGARAVNAVFPDDALAISLRIARLLYAD